MATSKVIPSDLSALDRASHFLKFFSEQAEEGSEVQRRLLLLSHRLGMAARISKRGDDCGSAMLSAELYHVLDGAGVPHCLAERGARDRASVHGGFCEDCAAITGQLASGT